MNLHPVERVLVLLFLSSPSVMLAQNTFKAGDAVEAYSSMTGRWEPATVQNVDGARYFVHAKDPKIVNEYWGVSATQIRAAGATAAQLRVPDGGNPSPQANPPAQGQPQNPQAPSSTPGAAKGAQTNRRPEGTTYYRIDQAGQKHLRAVASPGDMKPLGSWLLRTGGQAVLLDRSKSPDGSTTSRYQWAAQAAAGSLTINADGTFIHTQPGGRKEAGTWTDFGSNIIELKGYEGETWTASVWNGELEVVNPVGTRDWAYPNVIRRN